MFTDKLIKLLSAYQKLLIELEATVDLTTPRSSGGTLHLLPASLKERLAAASVDAENVAKLWARLHAMSMRDMP